MVSIVSGIHDNHKRGPVGDFLKEKIQKGAELSIVSAYFTIYAFEALKDQLLDINHLSFLFGEPGFIRSLDPDKTATNNALKWWKENGKIYISDPNIRSDDMVLAKSDKRVW